MKRLLCLAAAAATGVLLLAQTKPAPDIPKHLKELSIKVDATGQRSWERPAYQKITPLVKAGLPVTENLIGDTRYDRPTNATLSRRFWLFGDGTAGAVWTRGITEAGNFPDRGTGYNYFDGTAWGALPSARVESLRTGWPCYAPLGPGGEIIVSHSASTAGLVISRRTTKGSGAWTQSFLPGPASSPEIEWPTVVTSGPDHSIVHILALTAPTANGGTTYMGQDGAILYYRSSDGGNTWDIQHHYFSGLDTSNYIYLGADVYNWAWPRGDTLAFVVGNKWTDLVLMKSFNAGLDWQKEIIAYHPYPHFDFDQTLIVDTPYVCDGLTSVFLDPDGQAHVFFGLMRVNHDEVGDTYTYFPYTDGLVYWNESMAPLTTFDFDSLYDQGNVIGFVQDLNGNDTLDFIWGLEGLGKYIVSLSGMPSATMDEEGNIFVLFSSLMETHNNGAQNYRHLIGRASLDGGLSWVDTLIDLTSSILHNYDECIYPSIGVLSDEYIHYIYHCDEEPGMAVWGDEDPYTDNSIICGMAFKQDFGLGTRQYSSPAVAVEMAFPNPFRDYVTLEIGLGQAADLEVVVFSLTGQPVWSTNTGKVAAGKHTVQVDGTAFSPGVYFVTIRDGRHSVSRKIVRL